MFTLCVKEGLGFVLILFFGLGVFSRAICLVSGVVGRLPCLAGPPRALLWPTLTGSHRWPSLSPAPNHGAFLFQRRCLT